MNAKSVVNVSGSNNTNINNGNPLLAGVDTTLTKVFVGGLAWETPKEAMREHFEKYGQILEAVIISDKLTGRSKGYGFVILLSSFPGRFRFSSFLYSAGATC